jgi:hypothetical protein
MQIRTRLGKAKRLAMFSFQKVLLICAYWLFYYFGSSEKKHISWVIGVDEIAANIKYVSGAIPDSYSVCLGVNKYYDFQYNFAVPVSRYSSFQSLRRLIIGPILLGYLLNRADNFFYIWSSGFLMDSIDQREFEFRFIKSRPAIGKKPGEQTTIQESGCGKFIACFFVGNDIRAPRLTLQFAAEHGIEVTATYYSLVAPDRLSEAYDNSKRRLAAVTDRHADIIFNAPTDQMAYLTRETFPFIYFYPDQNFVRNDTKFSDLSLIKIVHAPSSPIVKGTQLVRAAVAKLKKEGYSIQYVELIDVSNEVVLHELRSAHIVLNEFYAHVPGLFGVEAMASYCALLTSADEFLERALPPRSNLAWCVTKYYEIYDNLRWLLDNPNKIIEYASSGYDWAWQNASFTCSGKRLKSLLSTVERFELIPHGE